MIILDGSFDQKGIARGQKGSERDHSSAKTLKDTLPLITLGFTYDVKKKKKKC